LALEVIEPQFAVVGNPDPVVDLLTHVLPELVLTYIFPVAAPDKTSAAVEPSALKTTHLRFVNPVIEIDVQVLPELLLTNSPPIDPDATTAIFVPSALEVID
jgi:hypothetical protein